MKKINIELWGLTNSDRIKKKETPRKTKFEQIEKFAIEGDY